MTNKMGVKGGLCWGLWIQRYGKEGWLFNNGHLSSEKKKKTDRQFFGKRKLQLSSLILFLTESPSHMDTS